MVVGHRLFVHPAAGGCFDSGGGGAVLSISIERVASTGSTNADLLSRLVRGEAQGEGHWLIADRQTAGRGRLGRSWNDGLGNFMGSTVVRLRANDPAASGLSLVAGIALAQTVALAAREAAVMLKWPNDLMVDGAKLAGILLERGGDAVVIGIGVNLVVAPEIMGRATISLADIGEAKIDRDTFADGLAANMQQSVHMWRSSGLAAVIATWLRHAHPVGTPLVVSETGASGTFDGLDSEGALRLRRADGSVMLVNAGDIVLAPDGNRGE